MYIVANTCPRWAAGAASPRALTANRNAAPKPTPATTDPTT